MYIKNCRSHTILVFFFFKLTVVYSYFRFREKKSLLLHHYLYKEREAVIFLLFIFSSIYVRAVPLSMWIREFPFNIIGICKGNTRTILWGKSLWLLDANTVSRLTTRSRHEPWKRNEKKFVISIEIRERWYFAKINGNPFIFGKKAKISIIRTCQSTFISFKCLE